MVFYFYVVAKGRTEPAENRLMHVVYSILRIGMVLICISELANFIYNFHVHNFIYWTDNPGAANAADSILRHSPQCFLNAASLDINVAGTGLCGRILVCLFLLFNLD